MKDLLPKEDEMLSSAGKKMTHRIAVEWVRWLQEQRSEINKASLENIGFFEDGVKLDITPEQIKQFEFTGLNNVDFILSGYYKESNGTHSGT